MRVTIVDFHRADKTANRIYVVLKPLKIKERFVYHVLELYNETGDVDRAKSRWELHARALPYIARRTVLHILKDNLHVRANKRRTGQLLTLRLKALRVENAEKLSHLYGKGGYKKNLVQRRTNFYDAT